MKWKRTGAYTAIQSQPPQSCAPKPASERPARRAKALRLRNEGWSWYQIGLELGVSHTTARNDVVKRVES